MGFFDRLGDAWDAVSNVVDPAASAIGTAYHAADNNLFGGALIAAAQQAVNPLSQVPGDALLSKGVNGTLQGIYSYGVARPLSTAAQVDTQGTFSNWLNPDSWNEAWDRSATVSPGQALVTDYEHGNAMKDPNSTAPDFIKSADPYSSANAPAFQHYFQDTWGGKLSSGAVDLLTNMVDPLGKAGKAAHAVEDAGLAIPEADRAVALQGANSELIGKTTASQRLSVNKTSTLIDTLQRSSPSEMMAMPQLRKAPSASALVLLINKAKSDNPQDVKVQRQAITDILGAAWGDKVSLQNLTENREELATQMENMSSAPRANVVAAQPQWLYGQWIGTDPTVDQGTRELDARTAEVQKHIDAINDVVAQGNQLPMRTGTTLVERAQQGKLLKATQGLDESRPRLGDAADLDKVDPAAQQAAHEAWLMQGPGSTPIRAVKGQLANRLPQHVNVQDTAVGFDQLSQYLDQMKYTPTAVKRSIADAFVTAPNTGARMQVVTRMRKRIVQDIGARYGFDKGTVQQLINSGESRLSSTRSSLQSSLYAALNNGDTAGGTVSFDDPEDGVMDAWDSPILQSQLENHVPVVDPSAVEKEFKTMTGQRWMQFGNKVGETTSKTDQRIADNVDNLSDISSAVLTRATKIWKTAALGRLAYPLRVQTDSQFRQMAHMEMMTYLGTRKAAIGGVGKYLMSSKDDPESFSFRNFFKTGDYHQAMKSMLMQDLGKGSAYNLTEDDVDDIIANINEHGYGMADLAGDITDKLVKKRRNGNFGVTRAQDTNWLPDYTRVLNRQIRNSPTAIKLMENEGDIAKTAAEVRSQSKTGGNLWNEYRNIGSHHGSVEDYLNKIDSINNYYLPDPKMQAAMLPGIHLDINRIGAPGEDFTPSKRPQGTYYSVLRKDVEGKEDNPFRSDYVNEHGAENITEKNGHTRNLRSPKVARLAPTSIDATGLRDAGPGGQGMLKDLQVDPSVAYLKKTARAPIWAAWMNIARRNGAPGLAKVLGKEFPDVDFTKFSDPLEQLMAAGSAAAKADGKKALYMGPSKPWMHDEQYVALTDDSVLDQKPFARNSQVTPQEISSWFSGSDGEAKRMDVHGEGYSLESQAADSAAFDGLRNKFFDFMGSMPENITARSPMFMYQYKQNIAKAIEGVDQDFIDTVGVDNIRKNAMRKARRDIGQVLYEASDMSNLSHTMRYVSPFFGAWEDTMKKWGMLMYNDPGILTKGQKALSSPNAFGQIPNTNHSLVVDDSGNRVDKNGFVFDSKGNRITDKDYRSGGQYIFLPKKLTSFLPGHVGDGGVKIRKDSINSVFQGSPWWLPGFGPAVQIPVNHIVRQMFPTESDNPIMKYVLPYGVTTDSATDQLLPKWAKSARNAFGGTQDYANQYGIFLAQAVIDNDHQPLTAKQQAKVANKTRNFFIMKAGLDNASPVSIVPDAKYQFYIDKAHQYAQDPTRQVKNDSLGHSGDWQQDFFNDFPQFGEMSLSLSANNTGINASNAVMPAIKKYRKDIAANPSFGYLFVGPSNKGDFSNGVYDWQLSNTAGQSQNFRSKKDPTLALSQLEANRGWDQYDSYMTAIDIRLQARGLVSVSQKGAEDLQYAKQQVIAQLKKTNPYWGQDYSQSVGGGKTQQLLSVANSFMAAHPDVKNRTDMKALAQYEQARVYVKQQLSLRTNTSLEYNPDLQYALQAYGAKLSNDNIGFQTMWNRTLQYDNLDDIKLNPDGSVAS